MRLSSRGEYSVRTMLALASSFGGGPVSLPQISQREQISLAYLEQLVAALRRNGLVEGVRGARGGYQLARPPEQVSLGDVLRAAEESISPVDCLSSEGEGCCHRESLCSARPAWARLRDTMAGMLDSTTLADLCRVGPGN